jgi:hypothetical protein
MCPCKVSRSRHLPLRSRSEKPSRLLPNEATAAFAATFRRVFGMPPTHYFDRPRHRLFFLNPALNGNTPLKWRLTAIKSVLYGISRQFHPRKSPAAKAVLKY